MKNRKKIARTMSELLKLSTLAFLGVFFVFIVNHYYQIKDYANTLSEGLNIFVFFDKNSKDEDKILEILNSESLVFVKEYVNVAEAYNKTVEKNPLLSNISLPNDSKFLQSYAVVKPKSIPDNDFLIKIRNTIEGITGVDEIILDVSDFLHYAKIQKQLLLYEKTFFIIISVFFVLLVLKFVLVYIAGSDMLKKAKRFFLYLLSTGLGFLLFWTVCKYINYSLLISETTVLLIIPFTCALGIMFDRIDIE
jgi:tryptophan-rich sensory protein